MWQDVGVADVDRIPRKDERVSVLHLNGTFKIFRVFKRSRTVDVKLIGGTVLCITIRSFRFGTVSLSGHRLGLRPGEAYRESRECPQGRYS